MEHWRSAFRKHWGKEAELKRLSGDCDLSFLAKTLDGTSFLLKVMRPGCVREIVEMQIAALSHVNAATTHPPLPRVRKTPAGKSLVTINDAEGRPRLCWVVHGLPGCHYAYFSPKTERLIGQLGRHVGTLDAIFRNFRHPALDRDFKWNPLRADWITGKMEIVGSSRRRMLSEIVGNFVAIRNVLQALPKQAIHNDINDYNVLVAGGPGEHPYVSGIVDLGDMCLAPRVCEIATAGAYIVLDHPKPDRALAWLVAGYHAANPLTETEIDLILPLLRMRLAVSVVNSALEKQKNPHDPYVTVSQAPAWRFLEHRNLHLATIPGRLRIACGLPVTAAASRILRWLDRRRGSFHPLAGTPLGNAEMYELSVQGSAYPENPFHLSPGEAAMIGASSNDTVPRLGYWKEPRLIYTASDFRESAEKTSARRTVHLGIDIFATENSLLFAPLDGVVHMVENRLSEQDYGGIAVLHHETDDGDFLYTIYGHLAPEIVDRLSPGDSVKKGEAFARMGATSVNGGWAPHVHFQLALCIEGMKEDGWPGVADPDDVVFMTALCPNPAAFLNLDDARVEFRPIAKKELLSRRRTRFGANLKLSYDEPLLLLRGWRHHLFDEWGRAYLDAYNNVPHVGHAHPRIRAATVDQLKRINANTRYLHPAPVAFAEKLAGKLPESLSVFYFVNSGSEANELALRLAGARTGGKAIVTPDRGYFGNTTGAMDISAHKFNAEGGAGPPDWVELVETADDYRGSFGREDPDRARKFSNQVRRAIDRLKDGGQALAGFVAETFPSVGGQIVPPKGYLAGVYKHVRAAGGVCIADEVQTGLGRLGGHYFGFEHQGVIPDIVVLGKPIGNGHPIGVVATTSEIARSFAREPEFFSTFGGSSLSARIGAEVLDIIDDEGLMENARRMGARLIAGLSELGDRYAAIGDIRGMGLFIGVDLVEDRTRKTPATALARYVATRMCECRVLIGTEGPFGNILKIRPPLTIEAEDIDTIVTVLDQVLSETPASMSP